MKYKDPFFCFNLLYLDRAQKVNEVDIMMLNKNMNKNMNMNMNMKKTKKLKQRRE